MERWNLSDYGAFFVDVDGVLANDTEPIEDAAAAFRALQAIGDVLVLTNNSTRSRRQHVERLHQLGFEVSPRQVVSSSFVAAERLHATCGAQTVWPIGEAGLIDELLASGHRLADSPEHAHWLVAGMDRSIDYRKFSDGLRALAAGARFAATNEDKTYPTPAGPIPGAGAIVGAFRGMGFDPERSFGKPNPAMYAVARELTNADKILMIGDRLETDIRGGNGFGIDTLLVLTGISQPADIDPSGVLPTWISGSLAELVAGAVTPVR